MPGNDTHAEYKLRKRGWSNISEDLKSVDQEDNELTEDEARVLLESTFLVTDENENSVEIMDEDKDDEEEVIEILDSDSDCIVEEDHGLSNGVSTVEKVDIAEIAKQRLSKWSVNLLDPNRQRGLIETPEILPLNDEFLSAFGKRSKSDDEELGRIPPAITGVQDDKEEEEVLSDLEETLTSPTKKLKSALKSNCKVKLSNLAYSTTERAIHQQCEQYGPVILTNVLLNEDKTRSIGRAFVLFENSDAASLCVKAMNHLLFEGRILNVSLAQEKARKSGGTFLRFWETDLSRKCFRCGEIGHLMADCQASEGIRKPCPLCAQNDHGIMNCPTSVVCFNCGVPGHPSRSCKLPRGLPNRVVCGTCFESGHHRWQCRAQPWNISSYDAVCLVCGQIGHFMCKGEYRHS